MFTATRVFLYGQAVFHCEVVLGQSQQNEEELGFLKTWSELGSCVKVEVAVLGSPSLTVLLVSVDVKQH